MQIDPLRIIGRKVILSLDIAIIATLLMLAKRIEDSHWLWAMTVTVISYIAAETIQKMKLGSAPMKYTEKEQIKLGLIPYVKTFWERIKALFSLDFLAAFILINVAHFFVYRGIIQPSIWFALVPLVASFYNVGNSLTKQ